MSWVSKPLAAWGAAAALAAGGLLAIYSPSGPTTAGCPEGANIATTAAGVKSALLANEDVCVVSQLGDVSLKELGSRPVVITTSETGSVGWFGLRETEDVTIRDARFGEAELWYSDGTTIEGSTIGGSAVARRKKPLLVIRVSPDVTIRDNEIAWTLAGVSGNDGYAIRSPGNELGYNDRLRIEGNYIHHIAADAIQGMGAGADDVVIDRNHIAYVGQEPGSDEHADAMQIIDHGENIQITNNWIDHEGYFDEGQPAGGSGSLYVHGDFGGSNTGAMLIENNLFTESLGRVLVGNLGTGGEGKSNVTIRQNTFLNLGKAFASFPSFHWDISTGTGNLIERNIGQDEDGGLAILGVEGTATWKDNLWRDSDTGPLSFDADGDCISLACSTEGDDPIGYRKPTGVSW